MTIRGTCIRGETKEIRLHQLICFRKLKSRLGQLKTSLMDALELISCVNVDDAIFLMPGLEGRDCIKGTLN